MRTQLQAISLRIQTVRSNEQMMQSMKGATTLLGSMNRQMNLPALQRIAMEFERENDIMDQRQEMMDDAIDDVTGLEDEEEGEEVVNQVLDEIGIDLGQSVCFHNHQHPSPRTNASLSSEKLLLVFRRAEFKRARLLKRWELELETRVIMTCRLAWTVYGSSNDELNDTYTISIDSVGPMNPHWFK